MRQRAWPWILLGSIVALSAFAIARRQPRTEPPPADHCDTGIASAHASAHHAPVKPLPASSEPTSHEGMIQIQGGEFWMGSDNAAMSDAHPVHRVKVRGFWIDATEVTNEQFQRFVRATGYVTVAERAPRAEDYPGVPPEKLLTGSIVFAAPSGPVSLTNAAVWWRYVERADWQHPEGRGSSLDGRMKHPVVHVAYEDAVAFATWAHKRLPTEAEWEFAARGGLDRQPYVWGDSMRPRGQVMANTYQGHFPNQNSREDGYLATAPVASFPPNGYGAYDMAGNVWEWVADWYRPDYYARLAKQGIVSDPQGPSDSFDPDEPGVQKRVQKGGSFLCTDQYCARYMPGGRGKGSPDSATNHIGFRCVMDDVDSAR